MKTFFLASAGCPRRAVDSQKIVNYLETNDLEYTENFKQADLIIISTCAALKSREDLSKSAIIYYQEEKAPDSKIVIAGCLGKINPEAIREFEDSGEILRIMKSVNESCGISSD